MEAVGVIVKTAKGVTEIQTRANQLSQKKRYLLILVDGQSTIAGMIAKFPGLGDIGPILRELLDEGFVEIKSAPGRAAATAATAATAAAPAGERFSDAVSVLSRQLYDLIGPTADDFTGRLEGAQDRAGFLAAVRSSTKMVESFAGKKKAALFEQNAMAIADRFFK